jgi:hypothetical protein
MERSLAGLIIAAFMLSTVAPSSARDSKYMLPVAAALEAQDGKQKLDGSVKFFFGSQETPQDPDQTRYRRYQSQDQCAVGKSDEKACNWVFLSAMMQLEKRAKELGANAVVNIVSYYQKNVVSSAQNSSVMPAQ